MLPGQTASSSSCLVVGLVARAREKNYVRCLIIIMLSQVLTSDIIFWQAIISSLQPNSSSASASLHKSIIYLRKEQIIEKTSEIEKKIRHRMSRKILNLCISA